jgi:hypothetical protein
MNEYKIDKEEWLEFNEQAVSYGGKSNLRFEDETYEGLNACF